MTYLALAHGNLASATADVANQRRRNRRVAGALETSPPPGLDPVHIEDLHPTQITVGLREVAQKRLRWRSRNRKAEERPVAPVVRGPGGALYLVDRHHLMRALAAEGVREVGIRPIGDFAALRPDEFWQALHARGWCHPYDAEGRLRPFGEIPASIDGLVDDPFRSLASALRRAGGFSKKSTPFSEFAWADFLRARISPTAITADFEGAVRRGLILARRRAARDLPGWRPDPASGPKARQGPPNAAC